jgi:hypothetical protein
LKQKEEKNEKNISSKQPSKHKKNISILPIAIWQTARSLFGFVLKTNSTQIQDLIKLSRLCFYCLSQMNIVTTFQMLKQVFFISCVTHKGSKMKVLSV